MAKHKHLISVYVFVFMLVLYTPMHFVKKTPPMDPHADKSKTLQIPSKNHGMKHGVKELTDNEIIYN